tara:strand:+ start:769 stop:1026 length:258 start_codon:yes stop_codon:yes gene_type:complete
MADFTRYDITVPSTPIITGSPCDQTAKIYILLVEMLAKLEGNAKSTQIAIQKGKEELEACHKELKDMQNAQGNQSITFRRYRNRS